MVGEIVEKLELDKLKRIYRDHVREDFPRSERRPFASMKRMTKAGKYACYGYYDNGSLLAYACYILTENGMYALLDYFAVVPGLRGHGVGSEFLQRLKNVASVKCGVFIEEESPDSAKTDEEVQIRKRRISFYLANGALLINSKCLLFGVDYNILYISQMIPDHSMEQLHCAVEEMYQEIYRPVYGRLCKPYAVEHEKQVGK
ncbi:MAG: GNAT family N-acetyltransferase [Lachnospiraceae bacterium]|nr:GNAT family N-acetyltransferase [Lachnospiraceae bacterium]